MGNKNIVLEIDKFKRMPRLCTCASLRKAARAITKLYDEFLHPSGLFATQFILLEALNAQGSIALTPLAEQLGMDPTTLARNLKPLERDGLIQVMAGTDRRTRILRLTDQGVDIYTKAYPLWEQAQNYVIGQLGEDRWQIMLADCSAVVSLARK